MVHPSGLLPPVESSCLKDSRSSRGYGEGAKKRRMMTGERGPETFRPGAFIRYRFIGTCVQPGTRLDTCRTPSSTLCLILVVLIFAALAGCSAPSPSMTDQQPAGIRMDQPSNGTILTNVTNRDSQPRTFTVRIDFYHGTEIADSQLITTPLIPPGGTWQEKVFVPRDMTSYRVNSVLVANDGETRPVLFDVTYA